MAQLTRPAGAHLLLEPLAGLAASPPGAAARRDAACAALPCAALLILIHVVVAAAVVGCRAPGPHISVMQGLWPAKPRQCAAAGLAPRQAGRLLRPAPRTCAAGAAAALHGEPVDGTHQVHLCPVRRPVQRLREGRGRAGAGG